MNILKSILAPLTDSEAKYLQCYADNNFIITNAAVDAETIPQCMSIMLKKADEKLPDDFFIEIDKSTKQRFRNVIGINKKYLTEV